MTSTGVNRPVNEKVKEQDVNNKLQLYGILTAFGNGKVPSNKQIDVALNSALASRPLASPSKKLSAEGQHLVTDLKNVIEQAKILLLTKNEGNLLQDFIWQTQLAGTGNASKPGAPIDRDTAKQHGNEALEGLRTLGTLIISNGQFRKLLNDATILFRDIAGDAAQKAANKVNPSEDELRQIDEPAEDNVWHENPDMSRGNIKNTLKNKYEKNKPFDRGDLQEARGDATQSAHPSGSRDPRDAAELAQRDQQTGGNSGVDAQDGARAGMESLKDRAKQNLPDEHLDRARDTRDRTRNYMKDKIPRERRDQAIFRLKKMVVEIQGHEDYQRAIDTLLRLAEEYSGHTKNLAQQSHGAVKGAHTDDSLQMAEADLKTLIERFANGTSLDDLFDSVNQIYRDADKDPELKGWFKKTDAYIRKCLKTQGYIMRDDATDEWNQLYDQGHYLLRDRYRNHTDRISDEFRFLAGQFDEDPHNRAFANALQKLFNDLGNDQNGKPTFKPHLIQDLTQVILPAFFTSVQYVPIPRLEYTDPMVDMVVENLVIESDNLTPNVLEFGSDNYWRWGRKTVSSKNKNKVMLSVSGVQMDLRDVSYYVHKKQGFPSVTDKGVMDIYMGGSGLTFKVDMETADNTDRQNFFKVNKVTVDIKNLKLKMKKSNHKLLFNLVKPILLKVMRPAIEKIVEKQIKDQINRVDGILYQVKREVDRAEADAKNNPDPQNLQNIYQRYVSAVNKQIMQGKEKKEDLKAKASDKKANVALTQHDSIFPQIQLPGGISTKATEYKDLARKGDKWESPIFGIGSAKETTNLPKVAAIRRKEHRVTQGGLRGENSTLRSHAGESTGQGYGNTGNFSSQVESSFNPSSTGYDGHSNYGTSNYDTGVTSNYGTSGYDTSATSNYGTSNYGNSGYSYDSSAAPKIAQSAVPNGATSTYTNGSPQGQGHTTLMGANNPVLTGSV